MSNQSGHVAMEHNGSRLGEGGLVGCSILVGCVCPLLPSPCYKLAAVNYRKTQIEELNKII